MTPMQLIMSMIAGAFLCFMLIGGFTNEARGEDSQCAEARSLYQQYQAGTLDVGMRALVRANLSTAKAWYRANCNRFTKRKGRKL